MTHLQSQMQRLISVWCVGLFNFVAQRLDFFEELQLLRGRDSSFFW